MKRTTGNEVEQVRRLPGASTATMHRLDLVGGATVVLRRYVWRGFLEAEPDGPEREVDCLRFATRAGLLVPTVVASDPTGGEVGDGVPVILMSYLRGRTVAVPDLGRLAETAAAIHAVKPDGLRHRYFPWYETEMMSPPPRSLSPTLWDRAIEIRRNGPGRYTPTLIHRDFHPGNVMWLRGALSGIVDWVNSCSGPLGCDLAHCRANLRALGGVSAGDEFVAAYQSLTGVELHPYWVVAGYLEHSRFHWTPAQLARDEPDLAAAVSEFG